MNDEFLLSDDDEVLDESSYFNPINDEEDSPPSDLEDSEESLSGSTEASIYKGLKDLSSVEVELIKAYDVVSKCTNPEDLELAVTTVVEHNPKHTSSTTVNNVIKELFHAQGHSRRQNSVYDSGPLKGEDILDEDGDEEFNDEFMKAYKEHITAFIGYLASRDLSEDDTASVKRKMRQLPAFIIFLFSSGNYGLLLNCPTMPPEYKEQVDFCFRKLQEEREKCVTDLAALYDEAGRHEVADKVRERGVVWFNKQPAEIKGLAEYRHLGITNEDVNIYKKFRPRWNNVSFSITQEIVSEYIEVCEDKKKGIYSKLRDKTRAEAITDVKKLFQDWSKDQGQEQSELAKKLIFK